MRATPFSQSEETFITSRLMHGEDHIATKTLQWVCEQCRLGRFFPDPNRVRPYLRSNLMRASSNARRWAVNALGLVGTGNDLQPILNQLRSADQDPDLLNSIVTTIFSARNSEAERILTSNNVEIEGIALIAASQFSLTHKKKLIEECIPIETENPGILRAAIVLAGLNNAPEHMFDNRFTNAICLGQLNLHDIAAVSKYSIWALAQRRFGFGSLLIKEEDIEGQPPEVRKWIFRLLVSDPYNLSRRLDLFSIIPRDSSREVREEVAIELSDFYAPGIEDHTKSWFFREEDQEVRDFLLDHMAAQSDRCPTYSDVVIEMYKTFPLGSAARQRVESSAARTNLWSDLRRISVEDERGRLFNMANDNEKPSTVVNQTFYAPVTGVSGSGNVSVNAANVVSSVTDPGAKAALEAVLDVIAKIDDAGRKAELAAAVEAAARTPERTAWTTLLGLLDKAKNASVAVGGLALAADKAIPLVAALV